MDTIDLHNDESIGKDNWFLCKLAIKLAIIIFYEKNYSRQRSKVK